MNDQPHLTTGAEAMVQSFAEAGMPAIFGVPGGGSSLDLIAAAKVAGIPFLLTRTENGAGIMASALAELTHKPVGLLTTRGPGVSNAANGMANAALERAPVILVADGFAARESRYVTHQLFDQAAMMAPVTRARGVGASEAPRVLAAAMGAPRGPGYLELAGDAARAPAAPGPAWAPPSLAAPSPSALAEARRMVLAAARPVLIIGLEATHPARASATRHLVEALGCPGLVTYKAKGVLPDSHPLFGGIFTGGEAEAPLLHEADLIILAGADPVEFVGQPWRYAAPILDLACAAREMVYRQPELAIIGAWEIAAAALAEDAPRRPWPEGRLGALRSAWLAGLENAPGGNRGMAPSDIVRVTQDACRRLGADPRVAVDAGAHMFAATTFWQAERPCDLLISNGLASMGYALPAAIAAAWHDPGRGAVAFTGDGGLLMAVGELAMAAAMGLNLTVVVFNDATLSLIDIKKGERDLPEGALDWPMVDFAAVMRGMGGMAWRVGDADALDAALAEAMASPGPRLLDVRTDPSSYPAQIKALRG
ncbi:thiamine pyrophosphate-dependent enzyme [Sediminicoccus sp. KRV36]|uniref:thiamine pyrophosphate-binding protein n=1 Tax=Sediminicoccus sp. KRV36 TaxID=3133721 RepID=UPI00200DF52B|nr:thiamine pyrophosphate-dependent enzyme [Sediminicoccus rosea]UPY38491.1 thiamine pyrophosphate-dependent enzyme [Sediminicoccus rosea]